MLGGLAALLKDPWRCLALAPLLVALSPLPARADGISGGLAAMQALALVAFAVFATAWIAAWLILRAWKRHRAESAAPSSRGHWLFDASIPLGLRVLAFVQYLLAPIYAFTALMRLLFPSHYRNGWIHPEVVQLILFGVFFSVLALVAAGGYLGRRDRTAFQRGIALGWLCIGNAVSFIALHSRHSVDFDGFSPLFGAVLLLLLYTRYRRHFEGGEEGATAPSSAAPG